MHSHGRASASGRTVAPSPVPSRGTGPNASALSSQSHLLSSTPCFPRGGDARISGAAEPRYARSVVPRKPRARGRRCGCGGIRMTMKDAPFPREVAVIQTSEIAIDPGAVSPALQRVVVGVDGSPESLAAMRQAAALTPAGAELVLVDAVGPAHDAALGVLEGAARRLATDRAVSARVGVGAAGDVLVT